jgi:N-methylhydantoinase A
MRVGVDVGGTFTDILITEEGTTEIIKTPSTPENPDEGVVDGLQIINDDPDWELNGVDFFAHGTTVATNAVLEDNWTESALITTEGFRDVLEIGRQDRPSLYDFQAEKRVPIIRRRHRYEVPERIGPDGEVQVELDERAARRVAKEIADANLPAVAICFLNSFEDHTHEQRVAEIVREEHSEASITLSSDVLPEIREYERTVTTAMSAGLEPVMGQYLGRLEQALDSVGVQASLTVMQSNGGVIAGEDARTKAVNTLLSGPAAGVEGATYVGEQAGYSDLITMDMGGTSCDVSIVPNGEPVLSSELEVGGYPVRIPMVDIHTIGNGGGSIASIDEGNALRVGPESAGANPGPICYGRGGTAVTITDAHAMLGRVDPSAFLGDDLGVSDQRLREAFEADLCDSVGASPESVAQDILDVTNANMERALNVISTERGWDPRSFTLIAFGGAGPLHAPALAKRLDIERILIPRYAGALSALGLQVADTVYDHVHSHVRRLDAVSIGQVQDKFNRLQHRGEEQLSEAGVPKSQRRFDRALDLRYVGQSFELTVPFEGEFTEPTVETLRDRFHEKHERRYGHANEEEPLELVNIRVSAVGESDSVNLAAETPTETTVNDVQKETRPVYFSDEVRQTAVFDRLKLPVGAEFEGPAIVEGPESTVTVFPDQAGRVDGHGNLLITQGAKQ